MLPSCLFSPSYVWLASFWSRSESRFLLYPTVFSILRWLSNLTNMVYKKPYSVEGWALSPHLPMPCWLCCFISPYALLLQLLNFSKRLHLKSNLNRIEVAGWFGEFTTTYQVATQHRPFQNIYQSGIIHLAIITECSPHARHGSGHQLNSSEKQNGPKLCLCQAYRNKWPSEGLTKYVIHW